MKNWGKKCRKEYWTGGTGTARQFLVGRSSNWRSEDKCAPEIKKVERNYKKRVYEKNNRGDER